jgi:hypothetical protein
MKILMFYNALFFKKSSSLGFRRFYQNWFDFFLQNFILNKLRDGFKILQKIISLGFQTIDSQTIHPRKFSKAIPTHQLSKASISNI